MKALIIKEFRELKRDHRTLGMLIAMPIVLLLILGYAANFTVEDIAVTIYGDDAEAVAELLDESEAASENFRIEAIDSAGNEEHAKVLLASGDSSVVILANGERPEDFHVFIDGADLFTAQTAAATFQKIFVEQLQDHMEQFIQQLQQQTTNPNSQPPSLPTQADQQDRVTILFNPDLKTSWIMVPGLIGLILTFIGTIITSIGLVREREAGTLEQLAVMPLSPWTIILGKITPYFLLALFDLAIITMLGIWLFDVPFVGNFWVFALTSAIFLFVVLGLGILISTVSLTVGQAIQLAIMLILPQVLLSGLIFPLDSMALWVRSIGYCLPLTWFIDICRGVFLRGTPLDGLWIPVAILSAMAIVVFSLAIIRMRKILSPGARS